MAEVMRWIVLILAVVGMYFWGYHDGFNHAINDVVHCRVVIGTSVQRQCGP